MKKFLKLFSILLGGSLVLAGCNDFTPNWPMSEPTEEDMAIDTPWVDYTVPCTSITLGKGETSLGLNKGETHQYTVNVEPRNVSLDSLTWSSDNESIATISNTGLLTAVAGGSANITVSCGETSMRSKVTVTVPIVDFEITNKNLNLDYSAEVQLVAAFTPTDTTQNKLSYELVGESNAVEVSKTGLVKAKQAEGTAQIKVTNEVMNKIETVNVTVSNYWNDVSLTLSGPTNLEVTKNGQVTSNIAGLDPSGLANSDVIYSVKAGSEELISVDSETGAITALKEGDATIVGTLSDGTGNDRAAKVAECVVHIFDIKPTSIRLVNAVGTADVETVNLDNKTKASEQLYVEYTLSDTAYENPSQGKHTVFVSSDANVAKVSDTGLIEVVGKGSATITVSDSNYPGAALTDTVVVNTTIYANSVEISKNGEFYLDESIEITANVNPSDTTSNVEWIYSNQYDHTFVESGKKVTITCNSLSQAFTVKAKVGDVESNVITLTPAERQVSFENGKVYIVGSSNYKTGVSKDCGTDGSWNTAKYAFIMKDPTGNQYAQFEYKATITFRENDLWKIREHVDTWREIQGFAGEPGNEYGIGRYKTDEGAFLKGQMSVSAGNEVQVNQAGKYDIYYAYYTNEHPEGWYEVYVEEHGLKLSTTNVHAKLTSPNATVSTITTSNREGTLSVADVDTDVITVEISPISQSIIITPVALGETTFKVRDTVSEVVVKEIPVHVEVKAGSSAAATDLYLRGSAVDNWGTSEENVLRVSATSDPTVEAEILDVFLGVGEFKIADESWAHSYGWSNDGHVVSGSAAVNFSEGSENNNIKCNVPASYNIYLKTDHTIVIELESGEVPIALSPYYIRGTVVSADPNWPALPANQMLLDGTANQAKILGIHFNEGEFKIANSDWTKVWGYYYKNSDEATDHVTVMGGAAGNFTVAAGDSGNIKCNVAGDYDIYLTNNNYISIEVHTNLVFGIDATSTSIAVGETFTVTASNVTGTFDYNITAGDSVASVSITDNVATLTALEAGSATIEFFDDVSDPIVFTLTVTATPVTYTVSFNGNGAEGSMANDPDQHGSYTLPANGFTVPAGHQFVGWKANNTGDTLAAGASYNVTADVTFYAQWELIPNNVTVYLKTNWGWGSPKAYVFNSLSSANKADYPGEAMTYVGVTDDNYMIFSYTVDLNLFDKIIFNNGNGGESNQTDDIDISSAVDGSGYRLSGRVAGEDSKITVDTWTYNASVISTKQAVFFTNNEGWSDPHVYVFNSSTDTSAAAWPGVDATWVFKNEYNQDVYLVLIDTALYDSFIFNGGGKQTEDIALSSLSGSNNAFFIQNETDGAGHYKVGQWTYPSA